MTIPGQDNLPVNDLPPTSSDTSEQTYVDMVPVGILTTASLPQNTKNLDDGVRPTARLHKRTDKELTRKRKRDPSTWKASIRKKLRQGGHQYTDAKGKIQPERKVKTKKDCTACKFKCTINFTEEERKDIFKEFWRQKDEEKHNFYAKTTFMTSCTRKRTLSTVSRKKNSLAYYLPLQNENIRVCKAFYLNTLDISQTRVNNYHATKTPASNTPTKYKWSGNKNRKLPDYIKEGIRQHIKSIPRVESHYCRRDTNKEYVAQCGLTVNALYQEYLTQCEDKGEIPGKLHLYRQIFNNEFNIAFHFPKSDRCDKCEEFRITTEPTEKQLEDYTLHRRSREETEAERNADRCNKDAFVVCFDLENVFSLPRANISSFFYKRKLNVYHMTTHCSVDRKAYGALWHEAQNGRSGNDIASTVVRLLEEIVADHKEDKRLKHITLWSDSCVPQNRNRMFSTAVKYFLSKHPEIKTVQHKYCEPGHSSVQEVDNLHSRIEKACGTNEIFSPLGLLRILKRVKSLKTMQMKPEHFKDFAQIASKGSYNKLPYSRVKTLKYEQTKPRQIEYKTSFSEDWKKETVFPKPKTRKGQSQCSSDCSKDYSKI